MVTRDKIQGLLDRVNRDQQRPVPLNTDAFGRKSISQDVYQMGLTLQEAKEVLENLLKEGIKG